MKTLSNKTIHSLLTAALSTLIFISTATAQYTEETGFNMPKLNPASPLADVSGNHVGIRVPDYDAAIKWWKEKLDFRVIYEWPYADEKLATWRRPMIIVSGWKCWQVENKNQFQLIKILLRALGSPAFIMSASMLKVLIKH